MRGMEEAAEIAGEAAGSAAVAHGGSQSEADGAAAEAVAHGGSQSEAGGAAAEAAKHGGGSAVRQRRMPMRGMEEAAEIAGEAAGSAVVAHGGSQSEAGGAAAEAVKHGCLLYTSPSPRDMRRTRMPSSA